MSYAHLTELRLTAFKSFHDQVLPIDPTTILIGRNGSGKSNVLDALDVLARLVDARDIKEALEPVRGGASGCAPHGADSFQLGCTVTSYAGTFEYNIDVRVRPQIEIQSEQVREIYPKGYGAVQLLGRLGRFVDNHVDEHLVEPVQGPVGGVGRLALTAAAQRASLISLYGALGTGTRLLDDAEGRPGGARLAADCIVEALSSVFHLEPVSSAMRSYVPEADYLLRRDARNVSAALAHLSVEDPPQMERLRELIGAVSDLDVVELGFTRTELGDVMLLVSETVGDLVETTPAREISDGLLRLAAVGTALLADREDLHVPSSMLVGGGATTLVMEEIDNGLHPAQAKRVLDLVRQATAEQGSRIILTTHNPALLDAATGEINRSVIVCYRNKQTGRSELSRVTDLPGYARAMTVGGIGDAVTQGRLAGPEERSTDDSVLRNILGIDA